MARRSRTLMSRFYVVCVRLPSGSLCCDGRCAHGEQESHKQLCLGASRRPSEESRPPRPRGPAGRHTGARGAATPQPDFLPHSDANSVGDSEPFGIQNPVIGSRGSAPHRIRRTGLGEGSAPRSNWSRRPRPRRCCRRSSAHRIPAPKTPPPSPSPGPFRPKRRKKRAESAQAILTAF